MRLTDFPLTTLKETPAEAEIVSHRLMLRAGLIRRAAAGIYSWLPLGVRVLRCVENIVREEMDRAGAMEVLLPAVQPAELWLESARWNEFGPELLRFQDRHERDFCFGPTHEEVITDILRGEVKSYRQLPVIYYQIQTKFRDEIRPRFGVMRAREFIMKDAYSFHVDQASLETAYETMHEAYSRIFTRLGLDFRVVAADSGAIGGKTSHEFHVLASSGEDVIAFSDGSDYAVNVELAEAPALGDESASTDETMTLVDTPGQHTISGLAEFLGVPESRCLKTLLVLGEDDAVIALCLRGDHELNVAKAQKIPGVASPLQFADEATVRAAAGVEPGSIGPIGLDLRIVVDHSAARMSSFVCGANEADKHLRGAQWGRDLALPETADLRNVVTGDRSPDGSGRIDLARGIEVGHIFQLGDKYSRAMDATVLDEDGRSRAMMMGCYGIGVTRIVAAAIEQNHDEQGIIWPAAMAPFEVALLPLNAHRSARVAEVAEALYRELEAAGFQVLLDDRGLRPGVMFAEMELIGVPYRVVVGERGLESDSVELKGRRDAEPTLIPRAEIVATLRGRMRG